MEKTNFPPNSSDYEQLKKYAEDLAKVCRSEKEKRKALHDANQQLIRFADDLNQTILQLKSAYQELEEAYRETVNRLVIASEYRDEDTGNHIVRIASYCALIADKIGLSKGEVEQIRMAAPMHDVGKIGIPDSILLKPGKLEKEEFDIIKSHTLIGASILADSRSEILQLGSKIAVSHHEKWNGTGYPNQLEGTDIPLAGRIAAVADVFDALTSKRPYKNAMPVEQATEILSKERGEHFDPELVDTFLDNMEAVLIVKAQASPPEGK